MGNKYSGSSSVLAASSSSSLSRLQLGSAEHPY